MKAGGFSEQQAATQAHALAEILDRQMASKAGIAEHENSLKRDIREAELRLEARIREAALKLEAKIAQTKADLTRWVIGAGLLQTSVIVGVLLKIANLF